MSTEDISRLILQKAGDLPEPKQTIIDAVSGEERPCQSIDEIMTTTQESSQHYMNPSSANRQIHFVSTTSDRVGPSGIKIDIEREINDENMRQVIPNYDQLTQEAREYAKTAQHKFKSVISSHSDEPKVLNYAYFFNCESGEFSDKKVEEDYYEAISTVPGKARHEGFHLSVIGRLPKPWVDGVLLFLQNVLASRCPPPSIKEMTRIPILLGTVLV